MKKQIYNYLVFAMLVCPISLWADNYVIINQVMYDARSATSSVSNGEFIELYNAGVDTVLLDGWQLTGDKPTEKITLSGTIPNGEYLIVACRRGDNNFRLDSVYDMPLDTNYQIVYQNKITLNNDGETITLINAQSDTIDWMYYDGESHASNPDRLSAPNTNGTPGNMWNSLHRTRVEFDGDGIVVSGMSQWQTSRVSFAESQLPYTSYNEDYITGNQALPEGENYVLKISPLDPISRIRLNDGHPSVSSGVRIHADLQYLDGLGRMDEAIALGITPGKHDLVSVSDFHDKRHVSRQWLPVVMSTEGQRMDIAAVHVQAQNDYGDDYPYAEAEYENSSLKRQTRQIRPGTNYRGSGARQIYDLNSAVDQVRLFTVVSDSALHTDGTYYAEATLYKNTVKDEENVTRITYTDKQGRKILEKRADNNTYYVYDELGRLRFVLPGLSSSQLSNGNYALSNATLKSIAYCYRYDSTGNMVYKRLPGCEAQYMVYNPRGQLVLKQDGNQRKSGKWTMCDYDTLGRNLYIAEVKLTQNHEQLISHFANHAQLDGYENLKPLIFNYYDNYDFIDTLPVQVRPCLSFEQKSGYGQQHDNATGLLTGTKVYNLSENGNTTTVYYYDIHGRVVQSREARSSGTFSVTSKEYLFDGSVSQQLTEQGTTDSLVLEHYRYTYDHAGRAKSVHYQLNNDAEIILSAFSYDSIGRVAQNLLHDNRDTIRYSYDMRNMPTETRNKHFSERLYYADSLPSGVSACHNGNIAAAYMANRDTACTFSYSYDAQNRLLSSVRLTKNGTSNSERFTYDEVGNVLSLQRFSNNRKIDDLHYDYGNEGNGLWSVNDNGQDADDYSTIEYHNAETQADTTMRYDANGNLILDIDRGISVIHYNLLNLPDTIQFSNGCMIINLYDAAGRKYKSLSYTIPHTATSPQHEVTHLPYGIDTAWYCLKEYTGNIERIYTPLDTTTCIHNTTGYYTDSTYFHYIKDHLGNICAVVNSTRDSVIQSTLYYASGVPMAQGFGRDKQSYLYNGKEFVEAHGWNTYDYGFRGYYAPIGRFTPLAESTPWQSPYAYANNNFINAVDWMGLGGLYSGYNLTGVNSSGVVVYHDDNIWDPRVFLVGDDWEEGDDVTNGLLVGWEIPGVFYKVGFCCDYLCCGGGSIFSGGYGTGMPNEGKTYVFNKGNSTPLNSNDIDASNGLFWYVNAKNFIDCNPFMWQGANGRYYNGTQLFGQGQYCFRNSYQKAVIRGTKGLWGVLGTAMSAASLYFAIEDISQNGLTIGNTLESIVASAGTLGGIAAWGVLGAGALTAAPYVITAVTIYGVIDFGWYVCTDNSISGWLDDRTK